MNTTYAKSKIEKLMAINTCKTANQNEAQTAFDMARKVAEKYKVLTWFYLTYVNPVNIPSEPVKNSVGLIFVMSFLICLEMNLLLIFASILLGMVIISMSILLFLMMNLNS